MQQRGQELTDWDYPTQLIETGDGHMEYELWCKREVVRRNSRGVVCGLFHEGGKCAVCYLNKQNLVTPKLSGKDSLERYRERRRDA